MEKVKNKILNWFFTTWLGNLYFEYLLWADRREHKAKFLTNKEAIQIIKEYSLIGEALKDVKAKVNSLVAAKDATEYNKVLFELEDLMKLSERSETDPKSKFAKVLRDTYVKKGNKDIVTHTDKAKMIDKRINDYKELHKHKEQRLILRQIRKAKQNGDLDLVKKLEQDWRDNVRSK